MKYIILLASLTSFAQKLDIHHLTGNYYVYTTYKDFNGTLFPSNSMYLVADEGVVMFDTPWDPEQFQPLLDSIQARHNKKVIMCIATHFHDDRTAGLEFLKNRGVKTYASYRTNDLCRERGEKHPEYIFEDNATFTIGNYKLETFYPGAGHSPDNIVIWCPSDKILYGGCFIKSTENNNLGNLSDADVAAWKKSVKKLMKKYPNPEYVIPGHFMWDKNALRHTKKLLDATKTPKKSH